VLARRSKALGQGMFLVDASRLVPFLTLESELVGGGIVTISAAILQETQALQSQ
jgi:hypothetical protein